MNDDVVLTKGKMVSRDRTFEKTGIGFQVILLSSNAFRLLLNSRISPEMRIPKKFGESDIGAASDVTNWNTQAYEI